MTAKANDFDGQELWFRCFHCGDSQKDYSKAHCSVNVYTNVYYCLRCQASGVLNGQDMTFYTKGIKLDPERLMDTLLNGNEREDMFDVIGARLRTGPGSNRYSAAKRFHLEFGDGSKIDVFESCTPDGTKVGYHVRPMDKKRIRTFGPKMFILPRSLRRNKPIRLVEGPWDQIDPHHDAACMGFPSETQVRALAGYNVILCPDGDVFQDYRKLKAFMKPFMYTNNVFVEYVERIPGGKDPDEVLPSGRERLTFDEVKQMVTPKRTFFLPRMGPQQILESITQEQTEEEFWAVN